MKGQTRGSGWQLEHAFTRLSCIIFLLRGPTALWIHRGLAPMCTQLSTKRLRFHSPVALFKLSRINSIATTSSSDWETDTHWIIPMIRFEREKKQNPWNNISVLCENVWNFKLRYVWFQNLDLIWMFEFKSSNFLTNLWFRMIMHRTAKNQTFLSYIHFFSLFMPDEPESSHTSKLVRRIVHSIENRNFANSLWTSSAARSSTIHIIKYSTNNGSTFNEIFQRDVETSLKPLLGYFDAI